MSEKFRVLLNDGRELNAKGSFESLSKQRLNKEYPFFKFDDLMIRKNSVTVIEKIEEERNEFVEYLLGLENRIAELEHQVNIHKFEEVIKKSEDNIKKHAEALENAENTSAKILNNLKHWEDKEKHSIQQKYEKYINLMVDKSYYHKEDLIGFFKTLDLRMKELNINSIEEIYRQYYIINQNDNPSYYMNKSSEFLESVSGKFHLNKLVDLMVVLQMCELNLFNNK